MKVEQITGRLVGRNWLLNLGGRAIPLLLGLITIPYLLRHLGIELFGVLSISWAILGYIGQFDLGLGRATTKFVAECLGRRQSEKLPGIVYTAVLSQVCFGIVGAIVLSSLTGVLVKHLLKISPSHLLETRNVLLIVACAFPVVVMANSLRGVLEAGQRFTLINLIEIPVNTSVFLVPLISIPFGVGLQGIVLLMVATRCVGVLTYMAACLKLLPVLRERIVIDPKMLRSLFVFGGWVTVSSLISPLLTYLDRFFVGSIVSMAAVAYYAVPFEIATKIGMVPAALLSTVFPAFSSLHAGGSQGRLETLYIRSIKSVMLVCGVTLLVLATFGHEILKRWLGPEFALKSTSTLQILALGAMLNCIAYVPFGLLQGLGRPDLTGKFHLLELPIYVVSLWFFLVHWGVPGAAWAWTLRVSIDALLLFAAVLKLKLISAHALQEKTLLRAAFVLLLLALLLVLPSTGTMPAIHFAISGMALVAFVAAVWYYVLDEVEKGLLLGATTQLRARLARTR